MWDHIHGGSTLSNLRSRISFQSKVSNAFNDPHPTNQDPKDFLLGLVYFKMFLSPLFTNSSSLCPTWAIIIRLIARVRINVLVRSKLRSFFWASSSCLKKRWPRWPFLYWKWWKNEKVLYGIKLQVLHFRRKRMTVCVWTKFLDLHYRHLNLTTMRVQLLVKKVKTIQTNARKCQG